MHARCPAERRRIYQPQDFRHQFYASAERPGEKILLSGDQAMLFQGGRQGLPKVLRRARLIEEAKDVSLVHRVDGRLLVGIPREHHPYSVWSDLPYPAQELYAVYVGHSHVGHDDSVRALGANRFQPFLAPQRWFQAELLAQRALVRLQNVGIVVHTEDAVVHNRAPCVNVA